MRPFRDLTVLSLEQATVLPYLTYRLAMDGMRVIRVEPPGRGDPNRRVGEPFRPEEPLMGSYYFAINAGKEAITLNLKEPRGRELLRELVAGLPVDIFATNQLPKNYEPLGIDYDTLRGARPDLIWVGVTGFGPDSNEAAYDPILQARGGLMDLTGEPDGPPEVVGVPLPDMGTSEHAYGQIMKALYRRALTGEGARIDVAMIDSTVSWLTQPITMATTFGKVMTRRGNTHEFFAPVSVYPTRDGYVYLAVGNDLQWQRLVALPGFEGLGDPAYETNAGRIGDVGRLNRRLAEVTRARGTEELLGLLRGARIPASPVQSVAEVCEDPAVRPKLLRARDRRTGFELTLAPPPVTTEFLEESGRELSFPPRLGEHNARVYGEVGVSDAELSRLRAEGVV